MQTRVTSGTSAARTATILCDCEEEQIDVLIQEMEDKRARIWEEAVKLSRMQEQFRVTPES